MEANGGLHFPAALSLRKNSSILIVLEAWWGLRASLDAVEKIKFLPLPGKEIGPIIPPAISVFFHYNLHFLIYFFEMLLIPSISSSLIGLF
jgi:hypothetical protein